MQKPSRFLITSVMRGFTREEPDIADLDEPIFLDIKHKLIFIYSSGYGEEKADNCYHVDLACG